MAHFFKSMSEVPPIRYDPADLEFRDFFGRTSDVQVGAEVFRVEKDPGTSVGSHFHDVDQFQLFFGSPGAFYQRHQVPAVLLQYADAYTTYGPFGAGPTEPLIFYTLRAQASGLHAKMPQEREKLRYRGRRHHQVDLQPLLDREPSPGERHVEVLLEPADDGLAAHAACLGAGAEVTGPSFEAASARCYCVVAGDVLVEGKRVEKYGLGWSTQGSEPPSLRAGDAGATVLFLDYPFPATPVTRLGHDELAASTS